MIADDAGNGKSETDKDFRRAAEQHEWGKAARRERSRYETAYLQGSPAVWRLFLRRALPGPLDDRRVVRARLALLGVIE